MYVSAIDEKQGLAVWYPSNPDAEDWKLHLADVERLCGWSKQLGMRPAVILLANEFERPDAKMRAKLAEITGRSNYDPYIAFVSSNVMLRGLLTMLGWMHAKPSYEISYLATEDEAVRWLERSRGESLPNLRPLIHEARMKLRQPASRANG